MAPADERAVALPEERRVAGGGGKEGGIGAEDEALPAARKAYAAIILAFSHGAASALDVIDARRSLFAVDIDTTNALADAAKARAAWAAARHRLELP